MDQKSFSEHREENFAAHVRFTRTVVSHDSLRCRQHRNAESVIDPRQVLHRGVNATPGLGDSLDLADDGLAVEILQLDLDLAAARGVLKRGVTADVTLGLEDLEHVLAHLRTRRGDLALRAHLRVADTGDQIADWIVRRHLNDPPYQLDFTRPGTMPLEPRSRIAMRDSLVKR